MQDTALSFGQFNDSYKPIMDGVGVCMENYARWLQRKYGRATVITPSYPGYFDDEEYAVMRYRSMSFPPMDPFRAGLPWLDRAFRKRLGRQRFDVVHAHCPFSSGTLAERTARRLGVPFVATFHSKYRDDFKKVLGSAALAEIGVRKVVRFYEKADLVWAPNRATAGTLRDYGFHGTVEVMPNGTDLAPPTAAQARSYRSQANELLEIGDTVPVFLFVGQHRWEKNVRLIIEATEALSGKKVDFLTVFAGTGYAADGMKQLVRKKGLSEKIRFLGLILEREKLKALYARATLFLFPSVYDNAPLVMREAAAFGCPSVLARGASAAEGVTDGENGFLTENDPSHLASLLDALVNDPQRVEQAGKGARSSIYLSWEAVVDQAHERYRDLIRTSQESEHWSLRS